MFYGVAIFGRGVMVTNSWESVTSAYADVSAVNSCPKQKFQCLHHGIFILKKKKKESNNQATKMQRHLLQVLFINNLHWLL